MHSAPHTHPHSSPVGRLRDGDRARRAGARFAAVRGASRVLAIGVASLALGTAAVLGLLFAAVALS
jgi:hypothetical protein